MPATAHGTRCPNEWHKRKSADETFHPHFYYFHRPLPVSNLLLRNNLENCGRQFVVRVNGKHFLAILF